MHISHEDDGKQGRFFITDHGETLAEMAYKWHDSHADITHTEVSDKLKGQGIGGKLVAEAVGWARARHLKLSASCPFALAIFMKKEEYNDVFFR